MIELYSINEEFQEISWNYDMSSWWEDKPIFYHGTHIKNLNKIKKNGLIAGKGSKGIGVYLALDPFTARGYASMSADGGESKFKRLSNPSHVPMNERAVLIIEIPIEELDQLKLSKKDSRLTDRESWEELGKDNHRYWELAEVVYPTNLPANYIKGFMVKE